MPPFCRRSPLCGKILCPASGQDAASNADAKVGPYPSVTSLDPPASSLPRPNQIADQSAPDVSFLLRFVLYEVSRNMNLYFIYANIHTIWVLYLISYLIVSFLTAFTPSSFRDSCTAVHYSGNKLSTTKVIDSHESEGFQHSVRSLCNTIVVNCRFKTIKTRKY